MEAPNDNSAQRLTRLLRVSTPVGIVLYVFQPPPGCIRISTPRRDVRSTNFVFAAGKSATHWHPRGAVAVCAVHTRPLTESRAHQSNTNTCRCDGEGEGRGNGELDTQ